MKRDKRILERKERKNLTVFQWRMRNDAGFKEKRKARIEAAKNIK